MSTILDIHAPWRDDLQPASFRGAFFHVESMSRTNGRRIVEHEFPKKELPYAEDMGRRAKSFSVRAYCITYPTNLASPLYNVDYRVARDFLIQALEAIGPATLQLPTLPPENVVVMQYRLAEEERFGGYCVFDIEFYEYGLPPQVLSLSQNTIYALNNAADIVRNQAASDINKMGLAGLVPAAENLAP